MVTPRSLRAVFLVTTEVAGHSPMLFLVEAESPAEAEGLMRAWLLGHDYIRSSDGESIPAVNVSTHMKVSALPTGSRGPVEPRAGSFLIDGRMVHSAE